MNYAYCGIDCDNCPIFIATIRKDFNPLQKFASEAVVRYGGTKEFYLRQRCYGCLQNTHVKTDYCSQCSVRNCAVDKKVKNCAYCNDFEACEILKVQNESALQPSRTNLLKIRQNIMK